MPSDRDIATAGSVLILASLSVATVIGFAIYGAVMFGGWTMVLFLILFLAIIYLIIGLIAKGYGI